MSALKIIGGPVLFRPSPTEISITWVTNRPCISEVTYGRGDRLDQRSSSSQHGLVDALTQAHVISLTGLDPGTDYTYRVTSREIRDFLDRKVVYGETVQSAPTGFRTFDSHRDSTSFLVVNDTHGDLDSLNEMLGRIEYDGLDFVVFLGDFVEHFFEPTDLWRYIISPAGEHFASRIPLVFVRGNHETRGSLARKLDRHLLGNQEHFYYTFRQAQAQFFVLDSGEDKEDKHLEYSGLAAFDAYRKVQTGWLREVFSSAEDLSGRPRIVFSHMPLFGGNNWHGERQIRKLWGPLFDRHGVDLVISGHTHELAHHPPAETGANFHTLINGQHMTARVEVSDQEIRVRIRDRGEVKLKELQISPDRADQS